MTGRHAFFYYSRTCRIGQPAPCVQAHIADIDSRPKIAYAAYRSLSRGRKGLPAKHQSHCIKPMPAVCQWRVHLRSVARPAITLSIPIGLQPAPGDPSRSPRNGATAAQAVPVAAMARIEISLRNIPARFWQFEYTSQKGSEQSFASASIGNAFRFVPPFTRSSSIFVPDESSPFLL